MQLARFAIQGKEGDIQKSSAKVSPNHKIPNRSAERSELLVS